MNVLNKLKLETEGIRISKHHAFTLKKCNRKSHDPTYKNKKIFIYYIYIYIYLEMLIVSEYQLNT